MVVLGNDVLVEADERTDRSKLTSPVMRTLRENRERIAALLKLRELHRGMGLTASDLKLIEAALLSGRISMVQIIVPGPAEIQ